MKYRRRTRRVCENQPRPICYIRQEQETEFMNRITNQVPLPQRSVLLLHFVEDFSLEEIAGITEMRRCGAVKSRLHYAEEITAKTARRRNENRSVRILLKRHQAVTPKLDTIRRGVLDTRLTSAATSTMHLLEVLWRELHLALSPGFGLELAAAPDADFSRSSAFSGGDNVSRLMSLESRIH